MLNVDNPRRALVLGLIAIALLMVAGGAVIALRAPSGALNRIGRTAPPAISHEIVLERLRDVAKLVANEMTLRDVVIYEQTRFRSTKRALLVVTGRVSAGINLRRAEVQIDSGAKKILVTLPAAEILAIEVLNVTTYDERSGILNPFTPDDRDLIQRRIRTQLGQAARNSGILEHADRSAVAALRDFLKIEGYTVEVRRPIELQQPTG